jgi:hypothetical protein
MNCTVTVRYLPEWFPGAKFKRDARIWNEELQELVHYPYRAVKEDLVCFELFLQQIVMVP